MENIDIKNLPEICHKCRSTHSMMGDKFTQERMKIMEEVSQKCPRLKGVSR